MNENSFVATATDSALYIIDKIRPEIAKGNFRAIYRYTQQLEALVKFAAIQEEQTYFGIPIIKPPFDNPHND